MTMTEKYRPNYSQLDSNLEIYFLASGGRDSTAMILEAWKQGISGKMLHGDTGLVKSEAKETLERLEKTTGYELIAIKAVSVLLKSLKETIEESFMKIPEAFERWQTTGRFQRNIFPCCRKLKHEPMNTYLKDFDKDSTVLIMGIKNEQPLHRWYRMKELRDQETFYRRQVNNGLLYYYPLRDCKIADIDAILKEFGFETTEGSGCRLCPIFCMFPNMRKKDPKTWIRSVTFARKRGIEVKGSKPARMVFCKGDEQE